LDWTFIAKKAFNIYFEGFLENKDHSIAQNSTNKFIKLFAIKAGYSFKNLSSNNVPQKTLIIFFNQFAERMRFLKEDKNYIDNGELLWPMHSWLSNQCYENLKLYGNTNFASIQKYIDEELTNYLPD
jgi:hypothetical protein